MPSFDRCSRCQSRLLHPQRTRPVSDSHVDVELRCAECGSWGRVRLTRMQAQDLDRAQTAGRHELLDAYEHSIRESMIALADCFTFALQHDLVGADDFGPRRAALP